MSYIENPKTRNSGIVCAIPQKGTCPNKCEDCFFQSGRSYLEPLEDNLPNMPNQLQTYGRLVRINDGNDSNIEYEKWVIDTEIYPMKFYNTAIPKNLERFDAPVVLTVNPGRMTDLDFHKLAFIPDNLMFVRVRVDMWNLDIVVRPVVQYYSNLSVPIVLTFMAYFNTANRIPFTNEHYYKFRKRTLNSYWAITTDAWRSVMKYWENTKYEKWVYSCGKIEGELGITTCRHCGNCLREYFATIERLRV